MEQLAAWAPVRGVIFDLDGTLVDTGLDFAAIRAAVGVPDGVGMLEWLRRQPPEIGEPAWEILHQFEAAGAASARLFPGVRELLAELQRRGILVAILTRNTRQSATLSCQLVELHVPLVVTREDAAPKPDPAGIAYILERWQLLPAEAVMVGDFHYDLDAGRRAGVRTVLYLGGRSAAELDYADRADLHLDCFTRPEGLLAWLVNHATA